jgi:hypothetical protein
MSEEVRPFLAAPGGSSVSANDARTCAKTWHGRLSAKKRQLDDEYEFSYRQ